MDAPDVASQLAAATPKLQGHSSLRKVLNQSVHAGLRIGGAEEQQVADHKRLPDPQTEDHELRCAACSAVPRLIQRMLDPRSGKTLRLYRCQCGEHVWEE